MTVPILKHGDYLIASVQSSLTDNQLKELLDSLVIKVASVRAKGVIVDVTILDIMDSFATRILRDMAHMIKLRGAPTVVVGIQPDVALAMVQLGLSLGDINTALDLEEGITLLNDYNNIDHNGKG
ncbi:MAG: STAS domain-containing protein [Balneolaceae bacterium]